MSRKQCPGSRSMCQQAAGKIKLNFKCEVHSVEPSLVRPLSPQPLFYSKEVTHYLYWLLGILDLLLPLFISKIFLHQVVCLSLGNRLRRPISLLNKSVPPPHHPHLAVCFLSICTVSLLLLWGGGSCCTTVKEGLRGRTSRNTVLTAKNTGESDYRKSSLLSTNRNVQKNIKKIYKSPRL